MRHALYTLVLLSIPLMAFGSDFSVTSVRKINPAAVEIWYSNGKCMALDFYGENIFRMFRDDNGGIIRAPEANPPAKILVDNPRHEVGQLTVGDSEGKVTISTNTICVEIDKSTTILSVIDLRTGKTVVEESSVPNITSRETTVSFKRRPLEYFYGGGVQNGRFSHTGKKIEIVNTNSWTDNGVCSPAPFYWSTNGYGVMCYTFAPGTYDFGSKDKSKVTITHDTDYLDLFIMVDSEPAALLNNYYQLTGNPVLLPKFGFYEGHLNAYNRDYWKETDKGGILFEDGKRYKESQKDNGGIKESLNGEKDNYQFSARAVVDRYRNNDMPLGWVLPNDGYGAGYGQASSLDGNIANLKSFGDYARSNGVEIGLWTQSKLHPIDSIAPLLQRDIVKEVRDAGVRVLKTDVAWVGDGYSFGLNGISDVANVMPYYGNDARPFIITLDGWAGTQRYGGVWTGDQTGGNWEYIRFHIPTYIGAGLSGMGNITSDMDGIFGGKNPIVNIRDFEWKAFTPMQLNMDGWGTSPKYPMAQGEPAASINRSYLKLKSMLLPYTYTFAYEATHGKPLIRAMFLDYPNGYTHGTATQYQYMYGNDFLVAPVYKATDTDTFGNDIRDGIYLPEGKWIDFFTGDTYDGGVVLNNYEVPIWKLPLFVKAGAIIPFVNPNNNVHEIDNSVRSFMFYPYGFSSFSLYDDDGTTEAYLHQRSSSTAVTSALDDKGNFTIVISPTTGSFDGMTTNKATRLIVNVTEKPKNIKASFNGKKTSIVETEGELQPGTWRYVDAPDLNRFSSKGSPLETLKVIRNPQVEILLPTADITDTETKVEIKGVVYDKPATLASHNGPMGVPSVKVKAEPYSVSLSWNGDKNADYYEALYEGQTYTNLRNGHFTFESMSPSTSYDIQLRAVNASGKGEWAKVEVKTLDDPLRDALHGATGSLEGAKDMSGFGIEHLFDFVETGDIWSTSYYHDCVPFSLTVDLHQTAQLDKMTYVPRKQGKTGIIEECEVFVSKDKKNWTSEGRQTWVLDATNKTVVFSDKPTARYIRLDVTKAYGNKGSGNELYIFKVPGTQTQVAGDINHDGKVDENDLTSYTNYTGLRRGDPDFDGYISKGDLNYNGLIDAFDISEVATQLDGGVEPNRKELGGTISVTADKRAYKAGEDILLTVSGKGLQAVNALSLVMPYDERQMQFVRIEPVAVKDMQNMTNDRLHKDGSKVLYPTFVNIGWKNDVEGDVTLFTIRFKAKRDMRLALPAVHGMLVDKKLTELDF